MRLSKTTLYLCSLGVVAAFHGAGGQNNAPMPLSLTQAIDLALKQNREVKLAQLAVVDSEHKKEIARSAYYPLIRNESKINHITDLAGVEIPAGAFGNHPDTGLIPCENLFLDHGANTSYTSGTGLEQPLTQMFKMREPNRAAPADIKSARAQVNLTQNGIALKVRQLYYGILVAQLKQQAAQEEVAASKVKLQESLNDVDRGQALEEVALQSRASTLDAQQTALVQRLQIHDLTISLDDLLGLPLNTNLVLEADSSAAAPVPSREECIRIAQDRTPEIKAAKQSVEKAKAGLAAAKDEYIPDVTALARYSYQSGIPFLVHNFGTFGFSLNYDLFDGGRREANVRDARSEVHSAEVAVDKLQSEIEVQVQGIYDRIDELRQMVDVAGQAVKVRTEAARLADLRFEQTAALSSVRSQSDADLASATASLLEASCGLSLSEADLKRAI